MFATGSSLRWGSLLAAGHEVEEDIQGSWISVSASLLYGNSHASCLYLFVLLWSRGLCAPASAHPALQSATLPSSQSPDHVPMVFVRSMLLKSTAPWRKTSSALSPWTFLPWLCPVVQVKNDPCHKVYGARKLPNAACSQLTGRMMFKVCNFSRRRRGALLDS